MAMATNSPHILYLVNECPWIVNPTIHRVLACFTYPFVVSMLEVISEQFDVFFLDFCRQVPPDDHPDVAELFQGLTLVPWMKLSIQDSFVKTKACQKMMDF